MTVQKRLFIGKRAQGGFTLMEVIVSVGILGFILTGLLAFFIEAAALNEASRNLTIATSHAEFVMEDLKSSNFSVLPDNIAAGIWTWDAAGIAAHRLTPLKNETVTTVATGDSDLLTVTVTVAWQSAAGRSSSISLSTKMGGA